MPTGWMAGRLPPKVQHRHTDLTTLDLPVDHQPSHLVGFTAPGSSHASDSTTPLASFFPHPVGGARSEMVAAGGAAPGERAPQAPYFGNPPSRSKLFLSVIPASPARSRSARSENSVHANATSWHILAKSPGSCGLTRVSWLASPNEVPARFSSSPLAALSDASYPNDILYTLYQHLRLDIPRCPQTHFLTHSLLFQPSSPNRSRHLDHIYRAPLLVTPSPP